MRIRRHWICRMFLTATIAGVAGFLVSIVQPLWSFSVLTWLEPRIVWRADVSEPFVALSFDDGPAPDHTPQVLAILARHHARATFFLIGNRAAAYPEWIEALRARGHEVGNHFISNRSTIRASDQEFLANLAKTETILGMQGSTKLFRPPGGLIRQSHLRLAEQRGYRVVLGSAYPYDPSHPPPSYVRWLVTKNLAPGVIVILHDGIADPSPTLSVLDSILAAGAEKGLQFITVAELIQKDQAHQPRRRGPATIG